MDQKAIPIIISAIALCGSLFYFFRRERIRKNGYHVTGEVIDFRTDSEGNREAVIRFKTLSGEIIEKKYHTTVRFRTKIGERIPIVYNPSKPTKFYINNSWERWMILLYITISLIFLIASAIFLK